MSSGQNKIKTLLSLAVLLAAFATMAAVNNLESYHLRHDFSTGSRVALLGPQCTSDFIENNGETAVAGPNGVANAVHPTAANNWGAVARNGLNVSTDYLAKNDWTVALCLHSGNDEKGVLFAVGRQNTSNGRSAISLCSSSDPTKLYLYDTRKSGSAAVETGHETITGLANMTNGFHTVVMSYAKASSNLTVYVDGVKKVTHKIGGGTKSYYVGEGLEYCQTMSYMPSALSTTWGNPDVSFYDMRFYFGAFSDADAEAYAALYPADRMGSPFRPSAYIEAGATNTTANAVVGSYIDTGYRAHGATTRFTADYQFLDLRGQQRIFGARCTDFTQGLYINGSAASGGKLAWNFMKTASWVSMGVDAVRSRQIAAFDRVGKTIAVTNSANRAQFYSNASHEELTKATGDATSTTYLFAENNFGAKNYGKARIYSFEADESGTPALFLAPDIENGEAGFRNIIDGSFHGDGNKNNNPERTLRFYDGVGRASDYKYENGTLYAKLYATSDAYGAVSVAGGAAATSAEGWVPRGGTLALTATASDPDRYEFCSWTGDTWAIADGYSVSNASIEVSTPYAVQLRASFKLTVNALFTIAADGADAVNWSAADWRDSDDSSVAISVPIDKEVTVVAHKSVTLTLDADVSLSKFIVQADTNCVVTFASNGSSTFYANEVVVSNGVLRQGSANVLGDTPKITVLDGGTFDINAKAIRQETPIYIAGAGAGDWPWALASSSGAMASNNYLFDLHLTADATIGGGQFKLGRSDSISFIYLNNHTLTAKSWVTLRNINTLKGTLDLQAGATFNATDNINRLDAYRGTTLIVHEGFTYNNQTDREVDVSYLKMYGGAIGYGSTARDFGVWNELHGYGVIKRLVMESGAEYYPDGEHYLNVTESLSGKLKVDISDPALAGKTRIPLLKVPTVLKDTADSAVDLSAVSRWGWTLSDNEEGGTNVYDLVMSVVPTLEANGSVAWSTGTWTADGRTVPAPASGLAGVNVTGTTTLTLDGTASIDTLIVNGGSGAKLTLVTVADATFNINRIVLNGSVTLENLSDGSGGGSVVSGSGANGLVVDPASMLFEGEGKIDVYSALSFNQRTSSASDCVVTILDGGALNQDAGGFTAVKSLIFENGASFWSRAATGHPTTIVSDTYAPNMIHTGSELTGPIVQLGDAQHLTPTLDLSRFCTNGVDVVFGADNTTFQSGSTVSVKLGDRTVGDQNGTKIASWSVKPQGVKFVCGDEGRSYMFAAGSDGLYIYRGFSVFLY